MAYMYNGVTYDYDLNANYTADIEAAVARGDMKSAAILEQQRNAKINAADYTGSQRGTETYKYVAYLDSAAGSNASAATQEQLTAAQKSVEALKNQPSAAEMAQQNPVAQQITTPPTTYEKYDPTAMQENLQQQKDLAQQQAEQRIDYATEQSVKELQRNEQDAQQQFQTQRNQVAEDERKGMDNSALYAEMRGDKGGIGQAQFNAVQAAAAQNRLAINQQQTKLATDTARQISDLRAQGEFEKADQLLTLTQNYLSQLLQLEQWANEYNLSIDQLNESIRQWQQNYNLSVQELNLSAAQWEKSYQADLAGLDMNLAQLGISNAQWNAEFQASQNQAQNESLAASGEALLSMGIMPSAAQLSALGMSESQASAYMAAAKAAAAASATKSSSTKSSATEDTVAEPVWGSGYGSGASNSSWSLILSTIRQNLANGKDETAISYFNDLLSQTTGTGANETAVISKDQYNQAVKLINSFGYNYATY